MFLDLRDKALREIPAHVFDMTQLTTLKMTDNLLTTVAPAIGRLRALKCLDLDCNRLVRLPRELGVLHALVSLMLDENALTSLPSELGRLPSLSQLWAQRNQLRWLPVSLTLLPPSTVVILNGNPLPFDVGGESEHACDVRPQLAEHLAATTMLSTIREEATTLAVGLADLDLPVLVTLEIVDASWPNDIRMAAKWDLLARVKHFHRQRL